MRKTWTEWIKIKINVLDFFLKTKMPREIDKIFKCLFCYEYVLIVFERLLSYVTFWIQMIKFWHFWRTVLETFPFFKFLFKKLLFTFKLMGYQYCPRFETWNVKKGNIEKWKKIESSKNTESQKHQSKFKFQNCNLLRREAPWICCRAVAL
jgi:hypothetical protein